MFWTSLEIACLDLARMLVEFALTWLVQSTLLIGSGLFLAWVLCRFGAAAQSIVYRGTLAAVVLCPIFSWFLSTAGINGYAFTTPAAWSPPSREAKAEPTPRADAATTEASAPSAPFPVSPLGSRNAAGRPIAFANHSTTPVDAPQKTGNAASPGSLDQGAAETFDQLAGATPTAEPAQRVVITPWGFAAIVLCLLWISISGVCAVRLVLAWRRLDRIRQSAIPADEAAIRVCRELSHRLGIAAPPVLLTPFAPGPCLTGWPTAAILLPDSNDPRSLGDVLTHELAHLVRGDVPWNLLRRSMMALFFFQPLLWHLSRRIDSTAEEVCDDWVVEHGHDRAAYALRLVETAEFAGTPMSMTGIAMFAHRSMLAQRVTRIMDCSRKLSTQTSRPLMVAILALLGMSAMALGLVQAAPRNSSIDPATGSSSNPEVLLPLLSQSQPGEAPNFFAEDKTLPSMEKDGEESIVRGQVRTPEGKPVAGAKISVRRHYYTAAAEWSPVATGVADANGKFELKYRNLASDGLGSDPFTIAAEAEGYGPQWESLAQIKPSTNLELKLPLEYPIKGRIVDLQGKPVGGVAIRLAGVSCPKPGENLDPWIAAVKSGAIRNGTSQKLGGALPAIHDSVAGTVHSEKDGRFTIRGVGAERVAEIELRHEKLAYQRLTVATRAMAPMSRNLWFHSGPDKPPTKDTVYGGDFTFPAAPTRVLEGTVRDAKTGRPIAGLDIETDHIAGSTYYPKNLLRTKTDEQGRYRLVGLPQGNGPLLADFNVLRLLPTGEIPYLMRMVTVPPSQGPGPQTLDLTLGQGIWISGRVTEKGTGKPVRARIQYLPYLDNPHTRNRPEFHDDGNMDGEQDWIVSDKEGKYRIPGLPGRAIVTALAPGAKFITGAGANEIEGMDQHGQFPTFRAPAQASAQLFHALKSIDLPPEATNAHCDLVVDSGVSTRLTILDEQGQPLSGCKIDFGESESSKTGELLITNLAPNEARELFLFHEERNLGKIVKIVWKDNAPLPMTAKLEKCATVKGKLTDLDGVPFKPLQLSPHPSGITQFRYVDGMLFTKPDGTFEFPHLPTGCAHYAFSAMGEGIEFAMIAEKVVIQAGQTIDLGTLKFKRMK